MSLLKKFAVKLREQHTTIERLSESLENQRALLQLAAHEMEMCGKHNEEPQQMIKRGMSGEILKDSPFFYRTITKLENECRNKDDDIARLKVEKTRLQEDLERARGIRK